MNLKKVLWATAILGLLICGFIAYQIYSAIFSPNTQFNNDEAFVYIETDASFSDVKTSLEPLLQDLSTFEAVAKRKGYITNIKAGKYALKRGMNNNEIINTLRSANLPVQVSFNNQESLALLAGRVAEQIEADSLELLQTFNDPEFLKETKFDEDTKLAMYIPNTYEFAQIQVEKLSQMIAKVKKGMKTMTNLGHMEILDSGASGAVNFVMGLSGKDVGVAYKERIDHGIYAVSVRGSKNCKVHLGRIVNLLATSLGGSGGGHDKACGAVVPKPKIKKFLTELNKKIK